MQQQQEKLEREERLYQEQMEQERQDRELALRLAHENNGQLEESPPMMRKYDTLSRSIVFAIASVFSP